MRKKFHHFIDLLFKHSIQISSIALIFLTIVDISNLNEWKISKYGLIDFPIGQILYILFVIIAIICALFSYEDSKTVKSLEKDNEKQASKIIDLETGLTEAVKEMQELFNYYLLILVKNLDFTHTERISVYKVFDDSFVLIGRSSHNPNLRLAGRSNYPLNEGFIGKAWAEGEYFINDLPDQTQRNGDTYYNKVNGICAIPRDVINNMSMLSRTFYINRINGYDALPKAIIVIESLEANAFTKEEVNDKLNSIMQPLVMFIDKNNRRSQQINQIGL